MYLLWYLDWVILLSMKIVSQHNSLEHPSPFLYYLQIRGVFLVLNMSVLKECINQLLLFLIGVLSETCQ